MVISMKAFFHEKPPKERRKNELMSSLPVPKAVAKMAIPSVISSLVTVVYNMADTFFVGQTGDPLQVAAVSLTNPIFILFMAFANMFGMGGSAAASMAMGEKNEKRMKQVSAFVTYASLIVGVALAVILMVFMTPVLNMFGANEQTFLYAKGYTFHIAYGAPFIIWSAAASFVVRAEGASKEAMIGILSGVCVTGLPTAVFSMLMSVSTIVLNQILVAYGNAPVAAIGIVFKANMFITFLQMGLANGVQPLLGYNYGSGDHKRFVSVERYTKKCCVIVGILATALFFVLREPIIRLFISDGEVVYYGVKMLIAYMLSGPVIGLLFVNMNCMQSVGNSFPATILSVMRQGLLLIPLLYLLNACMGLNGVIYGQAFTDYAAVILSAVLWRRIRRRIERR